MKILIVYDDTVKKSEVITDIIGNKGFADVVVRKKHLEEYYRKELQSIFPELIWKKVSRKADYEELLHQLQQYSGEDFRTLHCFSNFLIVNGKQASLSFRKLEYVNEPYAVMADGLAVGAAFPDADSYLQFCRDLSSEQKPWDLIIEMKERFRIEGLVYIGNIINFIQCIAGNFDSRYFNSLKGDEYTLVKSSSKKRKIKAEYCYYHLLPDDMKFWFVMPFNYQETEDSASYTMERLHMADLAVKWVHGSMERTEFEDLMDQYFYFFQSRHEKTCTSEEYRKTAQSLYEDKVRSRIADLKALPEYDTIRSMLEASGTPDLDELSEQYFRLKEQIEKKHHYPQKAVIGHGDPCFSNTLYNKSTRTLKFIDPKGALNEEELWTNPYYDVAKLSHSVCGRYDFFNNDLYEIRVNADFQYELEIPFDNSAYKTIFRRKLEENGFDYLTVRIYEASLFLSMLPLHIDHPHKVFGFILNAGNILKEIAEDV